MGVVDDQRDLENNIEIFNTMCRAIKYAQEHICSDATVADVEVYVANQIEEEMDYAEEHEGIKIDPDLALKRCDLGLQDLHQEIQDGTFQETVSFEDYANHCVEITPDEIVITYGGPSVRVDYSGNMAFQGGPISEKIFGQVDSSAAHFLKIWNDAYGFDEIKKEAKDEALEKSPALYSDYCSILKAATIRSDFKNILVQIKSDIDELKEEILDIDDRVDTIEEKILEIDDDEDLEDDVDLEDEKEQLEDEKNELEVEVSRLVDAYHAVETCIDVIYNRSNGANRGYGM